MAVVEQKPTAAQVVQLSRRRPSRHDKEPAMGWGVAAERAVARRSETDGLTRKDRFERIAAGLREQHFAADFHRDRGPVELQRIGQIAEARLGQEAAQCRPERCVDPAHLGQIVHRQAGRRCHRAAWIAANTRSGVNGMRVSRASTASSIALAMAAAMP
ncbi:MAG: hypothetical protein WB710_21195, partial [Stellaceae bacterium]